MPQMQLPIFPAGLTPITNDIAFQCEAGKVVYFYGHLPIFQHDADDVRSFRLFTSQLIVQGTVKQGDIVKAFGVPRITVKRYAKLLRRQGTSRHYWKQERACRKQEGPLGCWPTRCIKRFARAVW